MAHDIARRVFATDGRIDATIARLVLGLVMLPHGLQKTLGWFGGYGLSGPMGFFTDTMGLPWALALLVVAAESLGALGLIAGLGGRLAAFGVAATMVGAIVTVHAGHGFFMNWNGTQGGEGFEYHLLAIALAVGVVIRGSGAYSLDRRVAAALAPAASARPLPAHPVARAA